MFNRKQRNKGVNYDLSWLDENVVYYYGLKNTR